MELRITFSVNKESPQIAEALIIVNESGALIKHISTASDFELGNALKSLSAVDLTTVTQALGTWATGEYLLSGAVHADREYTPTAGQATKVDSNQKVGPEQNQHRRRSLTKKAAAKPPPPPKDLPRTYWKTGGTIGKVAAHYSVSRHVAQGWIKALRQNGSVPSPWQHLPRPPDSKP